MFDAKELLNVMLGTGQAGGQGVGSLGNLQNVAGALFGQATQGVSDAARHVDDKTGAGQSLQGMLGQLTGQSSGQLIAKAKELAGANQMTTGALLGTLGGLLLGTQTGRGIGAGAAKLGGLVMIGGLAYKAYQNYQQGKPLIDTGSGAFEAAPVDSGFGEATPDHQKSAIAALKAMIAAAAADGVIDPAERATILGAVKQAGLDPEAASFLEEEFANPASIDDLVGLAETPEAAVEIYTAARLAITPDAIAEKTFLYTLAKALGLDDQLVAHIEAAATGARKAA